MHWLCIFSCSGYWLWRNCVFGCNYQQSLGHIQLCILCNWPACGRSMVCSCSGIFYANHCFVKLHHWFHVLNANDTWLVQLIFLLWNASNDAFFGWLSDTSLTPHDHGRVGRRLPRIRAGGRLLGAAFVFAWFPWSQEGGLIAALHFLLSLCLYDAALTYVEVNYASLLVCVCVCLLSVCGYVTFTFCVFVFMCVCVCRPISRIPVKFEHCAILTR